MQRKTTVQLRIVAENIKFTSSVLFRKPNTYTVPNVLDNRCCRQSYVLYQLQL